MDIIYEGHLLWKAIRCNSFQLLVHSQQNNKYEAGVGIATCVGLPTLQLALSVAAQCSRETKTHRERQCPQSSGAV